MKFHELIRIRVSAKTIRDNLRLLEKVEEKERRAQNNQLMIHTPSLIDSKQILRRTR
jgi:hypothetical protein